MFDFWRRRKIDKLVAGEPLPRDDWARLVEPMPILAGLTRPEWQALYQRAAWFFADKEFGAPDDLEVSADMALVIAAQAALPILALDIDSYHDWKGVIVYPDAFITREAWGDEFGLVHEDEKVLVGQARGDGPLLLSWPDSAQSPLLDGWNVVIHECAHKLDMQTGAANGCPALHSGMKQAAWAEAFGRAYDTFCTEVEHGTAGWLDPYASESPAEFFAVLSEYFFEAPHWIQEHMPAVFGQLRLFYRQDPSRRLPRLPLTVIWPDAVRHAPM
ncbi:zinc-dependent peptidase [Laribacter hongkongensis]|uniref:M90 family metallopeptidase n=1 Tax=Laribacter hongkongensis TaxID=168471 RepID=UPI001878A67E|nr:M90 family metallopeptidase [Laribacter hongkongensis]MCG9051704.1 zinc-dependent peptidase [Laribacter hongkongensis]MCG9064949.1 zinc-dependent peptidase [Laribacter hongkongensis]